MRKIGFTLFTAPRTKKTHSEIVSFGKPCEFCLRKPHVKLRPSTQFEEFEQACLAYARRLRDAITAGGRIALPITSRVSIEAKFYRDADSGDWNGYTTALADVLQAERWKVPCPAAGCGSKRIITEHQLLVERPELKCSKCGEPFIPSPFHAKQSRRGLGIIDDDRLIQDWDGTRLLVDRAKPRIEILITTINEGLFE